MFIDTLYQIAVLAILVVIVYAGYMVYTKGIQNLTTQVLNTSGNAALGIVGASVNFSPGGRLINLIPGVNVGNSITSIPL